MSRDERRQSMTFDWSVIWTHRQALLEGAALTIALTVLTMLLAVPGGIVLALMRLSANRLLQRMSLCFVECFRNLPLILVIYWAFYVMPMATALQMSPRAPALGGVRGEGQGGRPAKVAVGDRVGGAGAEHLGLQRRDLPRRHQLDPQRAVGGRAGHGHVASPGAAQGRDPAGDAAHPAGDCQHLGRAVQGHLAGLGHRRR